MPGVRKLKNTWLFDIPIFSNLKGSCRTPSLTRKFRMAIIADVLHRYWMEVVEVYVLHLHEFRKHCNAYFNNKEARIKRKYTQQDTEVIETSAADEFEKSQNKFNNQIIALQINSRYGMCRIPLNIGKNWVTRGQPMRKTQCPKLTTS